MSIKSVDMQVLVPKVADIARIQKTPAIEANHRQGEFSQIISNQNLANRQKVQELKDPEAQILQDKHNKKRQQEGKGEPGRSRSSEQEEEQNLFTGFVKGNTIDIKI